MSEGERRLAAIMFTDMVGYTALGQRNESLSLALVEEQRKLIRPILGRHNGREIKTMGDAFLVEFPNALDAVRCAYDIQRETREFNFSLQAEQRIHLRIGIHAGDVVESQGDASGDVVNVASRIDALAEDGGVCLTRPVYEHVTNKFELPLVSLGPKTLKNVITPMEVYKMEMPWDKLTPEAQSAQLPANRVAVLPFVSISPDASDEYFADGLTEELISRLSLLNELEVIARTSAMTYKKKEKTAAQIGKELGAGTLLEGSVRKSGNRIRVTAQLINANTEGHLWMENYDRSIEDIFAVQREVAEKVASSLRLRLTERDRKKIEKAGTSNVEAYTLYLKGRFYSTRYDKNSLSTAISYFEEAIAKDPNYALAYCGLAMAHSSLGFAEIVSNKEAAKKAKQYALKALELDESLPEAHLSLAMAHTNEYDSLGVIRETKKVIELNPNLVYAHILLEAHFGYMGRWEECVREIERSLELDPLSVLTSGDAGTWYLYAGQYDKAIEHLKNAVELDPTNSFFLGNLGLAHVQKGLVKEGMAEAKRALEMSGSPFDVPGLAYAYVKAQKPEEARKLLARLQKPEKGETIPPTLIAGIYAVLGEKERAIEWLERAYEERSGYLVAIGADFVFKDLRGEPRFQALLVKMGLKTTQ